MERRIRSFDTLTDDLRDKLQEQYPDGIENSHIRTVNTPKGETLRVIELTTPDIMYLIKVNTESREAMDEFLEQDSDDERDSDNESDSDTIEGNDDLEGADDDEEEEADKDAAPVDDDDDDED